MARNGSIPYLSDLLRLFYPQICVGCQSHLQKSEAVICRSCITQLPETKYSASFHPLADRLKAQFPFENVFGLYYFNRKSLLQQLMHKIKYGNRRDIAYVLGKHLGVMMKNQLDNKDSILIPVPLHKKREAKRGYNQSLAISEGIATELNLPINAKYLTRSKATITQTGISRIERFANLQTAFTVVAKHKPTTKHLILVDDVITTGATVLACAQQLNKVPGFSISVASVGVTEDI